MIHPTAIIDPSAELAADIEIGPFTIIGAGVCVESGTRIGSHVVIKGPTHIGHDNIIYQFSSIGENPQDKKYRGETTYLQIGDRNVIREYCTLHRGTIQDNSITRIGSDNLLMAYVHVAHDCVIGNDVIMANAASLAGHVQVDDHAILGGFSLVHQFCRIGQHCFAAMGSIIARDIPPFVMVGGHPTKPHGINSVGLERRKFSTDNIQAIKKAYKLIYKKGLMLDDAVKQLEQMAHEFSEIGIMVEFLQHRGRSIMR